MRFSFFSWLRAKTREAIMAGFADAVEELDSDESPDLDALRERLAATKQLPARADDEPAKKGRGK